MHKVCVDTLNLGKFVVNLGCSYGLFLLVNSFIQEEGLEYMKIWCNIQVILYRLQRLTEKLLVVFFHFSVLSCKFL